MSLPVKLAQMSRPTSWGKGERGEPGVPERRGEPRELLRERGDGGAAAFVRRVRAAKGGACERQTWDFRGPRRVGRSGGDAPQ